MPLTSAQGEVQIVPTMRGFQSKVRAGVKATRVDPFEVQVKLDKKSLADAEIAARKSAEAVAKARDAEAGAADRVKQAETSLADARRKSAADSVAAVEAAEQRLQKSRDAMSAAAGRTLLAERRLEEARAKSAQGSAAILAAEQRLQAARDNESRTSNAVEAAEKQLTATRKAGAANSAAITASEEKLAQAKRNAVSASSALNRAMADDESARNRVTSANARLQQSMDRLQSSGRSLRSIFSGIDDGKLRNVDKAMSSAVGSALRLGAVSTAAASAVVGIGAATGPVLALSSALVTAAGSAALIPAALSAGAASFGAIKIGISGLSEAFKGYSADAGAASKASSNNAKTELSNARQVRDAKKSISEAERDRTRTARDGAVQIAAASKRVTAAVEDEKRAQKELSESYKEARRSLLDLQTAQLGNALDATGAQIAYERQIQRTNEIMRSSTATDLDKREAQNDLAQSQLRVTESIQRQKRGQEDLIDAERKGIAGSDQVVSARDRLRAAQDNVRDSRAELSRTEVSAAEANADASARVSDAVQNLADITAQQAVAADQAAGATSKFNDALAKLSPNARDFVKTVVGMEDRWNALKNTVQDRMFAGFSDEVKLLADAQLPVMERGLSAIAAGMNTAALETSGFLRSAQGVASTSKIFDNTSLATKGLARAAGPLTNIFLSISAIGSEFLPGLTNGFANAAEKAAAFVNSAEGAQRVREWIGNGLQALKQLGQLLWNVGGIVNTVFQTANEVGGSTLQMLVDLTKQANEWVKSAEGQEVLRTLFISIRDVVRELAPGVKAVLGALKDAFLTLAPSLPGLARAFSGIAEALAPLVGWIADGLKALIDYVLIPFGNWARENPGAMQVIAVAIIGVVAAIKTLNMVSSVVKWCSGIAGAIGTIRDAAEKAGISVDGKKGLTNSLKVLKTIGKIAVPIAIIWSLQEIAEAYKPINDRVQMDPKTGQPVTPEQRSLKQAGSDAVNSTLEQYQKNPLEGWVPTENDTFFTWFFGRTPEEMASGIKNSFMGKLSQGLDATLGTWLDENIAFPVQGFFRDLPGKLQGASDSLGNWTETNIRQPIVNKFVEVRDGISARAGEASSWVSTKFTEMRDGINARATEARDWTSGKFSEARDWINARATEARDWTSTRYRELKDWISARATEARDWVSLRYTEAKDWIIARATEARDWVHTRFRELKDWVISRATEARDWVSLRYTEAKDWIIARATEARDWVNTRFLELKNWIISRATEARDWVVLRFTEAKDWLIMRATEARDWVTTRFTELKDGSIQRVTEAKDWIVTRATELRDGFIGRITELKDTVIAKWNELRAGFRDPIKWVVDTVYNGAIGNLWSKARAILPALPEFKPVDYGFRDGGPVRGMGTGTSDSITARLSNGEHVLTAAEVSAMGGHNYVLGMRQAALNGTLPQFAAGGPVMWQELWSTVRGQFPSATLNSHYRPGQPGEHGVGRAIDVGGPMMAVNRWLAQMFPGSHELIYTPGVNLFNGAPHQYDAATRAGHNDHVHWANVSKNGEGGGSGNGILSGLFNFALDKITKLFDSTTNPLRDQANRMFPGDELVRRIPRDMVHSVLDNVRSVLFSSADSAGGIMMDANGADQLANARVIGDVARMMGFGRNGVVVALATALQESGLRNLNHGDRDSLGLFQQRPSMGWGSPQQIMNPGYAASKFFATLRGVRGWESMPVTVAAQRVQRSGFPDAYAKWVPTANSLASQVGFTDGGVVPGSGFGIRDNTLVLAQGGERVLSREQNAAFEDLVFRGTGTDAAVRNAQSNRALRALGTVAPTPRERGQLFGDVHVHDKTDVDLLMSQAEFAASSRGL